MNDPIAPAPDDDDASPRLDPRPVHGVQADRQRLCKRRLDVGAALRDRDEGARRARRRARRGRRAWTGPGCSSGRTGWSARLDTTDTFRTRPRHRRPPAVPTHERASAAGVDHGPDELVAEHRRARRGRCPGAVIRAGPSSGPSRTRWRRCRRGRCSATSMTTSPACGLRVRALLDPQVERRVQHSCAHDVGSSRERQSAADEVMCTLTWDPSSSTAAIAWSASARR